MTGWYYIMEGTVMIERDAQRQAILHKAAAESQLVDEPVQVAARIGIALDLQTAHHVTDIDHTDRTETGHGLRILGIQLPLIVGLGGRRCRRRFDTAMPFIAPHQALRVQKGGDPCPTGPISCGSCSRLCQLIQDRGGAPARVRTA